MKIVKKLIYLVILIALVVVVALAGLFFFVDPNKLKPVITKEVSKRTGYELTIEGNLSWSFYPLVGIKAQHMLLRAPKERALLADLKDITVAADLRQLLHGQQKIRGDIYIAGLKLMQLQASRVHVGLAWQGENLLLKPINASFYHGTVKGEAVGSHLSQIPEWRWNVAFSGIQMKPLLKDLNNDEEKLLTVKGKAYMNMLANAQGVSSQQMLHTLDGQVVFHLDDGALEGINLNYFVESASALLNKKPMPVPTGENVTRFDSMTGTAAIKRGIAEINNLFLISHAFSARGEGSINLPDETLNYHLQVIPTTKEENKWIVPVQLVGNLSRPTIRLDVTEIDKMIAKEKIEKVKEKVQEKIKQLPEEANKFLRKLTGE